VTLQASVVPQKILTMKEQSDKGKAEFLYFRLRCTAKGIILTAKLLFRQAKFLWLQPI